MGTVFALPQARIARISCAKPRGHLRLIRQSFAAIASLNTLALALYLPRA